MDARLLFCDEPTTLLNPIEGYHVISALRKLAITGNRIVMCSLKRPTSEVYAMFDHVMLMSWGRVVFMGTTEEALHFFTEIGWPCPKYFNPSDHFMHYITQRIRLHEEYQIDELSDKYLESGYGRRFTADSFQVSEYEFEIHEEDEEDLEMESKFTLWFRLFWIYLGRCRTCAKRDPLLTTHQITHGFGASLFLSCMFFGHKMTQGRVFAINSICFIIILSLTFRNVLTVVFALCRDMTAFIIEQGHSLLKTSAFFLARAIAEFSIMFFYPLMFTSIVYWCVGFRPDPKIYCFSILVICLTANVTVSFAHFIACLLKDEKTAAPAAFMICIAMATYGGFLLHDNAMPYHSKWVRRLSWFWYANELLLVNQWDGYEEIECEFVNNTLCLDDGSDVIHVFGYLTGKNKLDLFCLFVFFIGYRLIAFIIFLVRVHVRSWEKDITDSA